MLLGAVNPYVCPWSNPDYIMDSEGKKIEVKPTKALEARATSPDTLEAEVEAVDSLAKREIVDLEATSPNVLNTRVEFEVTSPTSRHGSC